MFKENIGDNDAAAADDDDDSCFCSRQYRSLIQE